MVKSWYVVHTRAGQEKKVKSLLDHFIKQGESNIFEVIVPTEEITEIVKGQRKISPREFLPGYILVKMDFNEEIWYRIQSIPGVLDILGEGNMPTPLPEEEIQTLLNVLEEKKKPAPRLEFEKGEHIEIKDGPFANFSGIIKEVKPDKEKLKVSVFIFGRATLVELEYWQVEKV
ncbi:MAG: transcription termination/antitermination protein NusG [bacterium (Candidatus Ratteibacteria) CG_4_10_14_3_um_filter_41_18]|uniref:Transcription termination/antitermination protein NusG n=3 Tax=Candidatus Ratteibacteria TaxID=2979319 RepID=A0A2M7YEN8_9BACT|nr:MAG: transcription termination/antitermination factor NusG [Candidatus Omnitrophica bacterium CG1_02_41_171]PIW31041.1 MAG: transcription termination/antitermination protein NusG [bacterium (Candidatus Ratteibacteria) CG15_BIG_FIL_POST_REV_8_21_14_020_41_12]PIW74205.1 MAG: transcription termination/antitermination protein NusG [bacterium (Candidatus Ratteibacteria) CG_4_8_14_3_um_filter_41_36]PIX76720.1 MAG: transcription termination/antitermination protein NusG [bacterium (Candidatus Ratteib